MILELSLAIGFIALSVLGLVLVRRRVPLERLMEHHEVAGVCFAVVGGFYGIILAFVLVSSWERYEVARGQTEVEAAAAADLQRQSAGLSEPTRSRLRDAVLAYMKSVLEEEWPAMSSGRSSPATQERYAEVWSSLIEAKPTSPSELELYQTSLGKLDDFADARRARIFYMNSGLPTVIWVFLVSFGIATVAFTYLFGMRRLAPQIAMTALLAATIAWTLVLIREAQTPFSGELRVSDRAFHLALEMLQRPGTPPAAGTPR